MNARVSYLKPLSYWVWPKNSPASLVAQILLQRCLVVPLPDSPPRRHAVVGTKGGEGWSSTTVLLIRGPPKLEYGGWESLRIHSLRTCIFLTTVPPSSGVVHIGHEVGHQLRLRICCSQNMSRWILGPKTLSKTIQEGKDPTGVRVDFLCPLGYS